MTAALTPREAAEAFARHWSTSNNPMPQDAHDWIEQHWPQPVAVTGDALRTAYLSEYHRQFPKVYDQTICAWADEDPNMQRVWHRAAARLSGHAAPVAPAAPTPNSGATGSSVVDAAPMVVPAGTSAYMVRYVGTDVPLAVRFTLDGATSVVASFRDGALEVVPVRVLPATLEPKP